MSILVLVQNEAGERIEDAPSLSFQNIVSWGNRDRFPMLAYIDPMGITVFNRLQVRALMEELSSVRESISRVGVAATIIEIGATEVESYEAIPDWDAETGLGSLVDQLIGVCSVSLEKYHRYLWFLGD